MMEIKVKKLRYNSIMPTKAHDTDAGLDFYWCPSDKNYYGNKTDEDCLNSIVKTDGYKSWLVLQTGVSVSIPEGYCMVLFGRSGLGSKYGFDSMGGVIDSGYTGEVHVILDVPKGIDGITQVVKDEVIPGFKCAQGLILPVPKISLIEVESLDDTKRGNNGFGSSDEPKVVKNS
jgi:dUTP pyrophosphatase